MSVDNDVAAITKVHQAWYASNLGLIADAMLGYFPEGDGYLQFNLNGLTYRGVLDKARLWRNARAAGVDIARIEDTAPPVVQVFGDVALLTAQGECELVLPSATGRLERQGATPFRTTEFYRRDDGRGNPDWRIWHMHASEAAPEGSLRYISE